MIQFTGSAIVAIIFGALILVFPAALRFLVGGYLLLAGILSLLGI